MLSEGLSCLKCQGHPRNLPGTKQGWEGHLPLCYLQLVLMACQEVQLWGLQGRGGSQETCTQLLLGSFSAQADELRLIYGEDVTLDLVAQLGLQVTQLLLQPREG